MTWACWASFQNLHSRGPLALPFINSDSSLHDTLCWSRRLLGILKCELYFHCTSTELWTRELLNITGPVNSEPESLWCVNEVCDFLHLQDSLNVILRIPFQVNCIFPCHCRKNFKTKIMSFTLKKNTQESIIIY